MKTIRKRGIAFALGTLAFATAHLIEAALWTSWFGGAHDPWFLNSGRAVACMTALLFGVSLAGGGIGLSGTMISAGAFMAMVAIMFLKNSGPGTIFPIVMAFGGLLILGTVSLGAWLGREVRGLRDS